MNEPGGDAPRTDLVDLDDAGEPLETLDHALVLDQEQRRYGPDVQPAHEVRMPIDVDVLDAQPASLLPCEVREHALHPAGRA